MAGVSSETSRDNLPITRVAIPDDHSFVHIGTCRYIKFQFGGANYLECSQCSVRTYYQHHTTKFYHLRSCIHWRNSFNIPDAHQVRPEAAPQCAGVSRPVPSVAQPARYIASTCHNPASSEIPPPYTEYDATLPAYEP